MKKITAALLSILITVLFIPAADSFAQGQAGAYCLKIAPGARANGMGGSSVAMVEDATSLWWNPAGMSFLEYSMADIMHTKLVPTLAADVFFDYAGIVHHLGNGISVGFAFQYLSYGEWVATNTSGEELGNASSYEMSPMIGASMRLGENFSVGMNFKFVYIDLAPEWATVEGEEGVGHSVGLDIGCLYRVPEFSYAGYTVTGLRLGAAISNLGPSITYIDSDQAAPLPRTVRVGFGYTPVRGELFEINVAGDVERLLIDGDIDPIYHAGSEFVYTDLFAVRVGYLYDKDGDVQGVSYGLGFNISNRIRVDYGNVPQHEDLDRVHRWSLGLNF